MNQILYANDYQTAVTEIEAAGGRVLQQFSERVFVAFLPDTYALETLQSSSQQAGWTLSRQEQLLVNSWQRFQDRKQTPVERDTHSWDAMGFEYPRNPSNDPDLARELLGLQQLAELGVYVQTDTSKVMRGSATIGLLLVSGPTKNLQLSNDEIMHAISQVNEGAQLLIEAEPRAALSFSYRVDEVTVTAPDKPALYRDIYFIFPLPNASSLFLFWQSEAGWAAVRPINHYPSGNLVMPATSEQWSVIWDPDYRLYMPFVLNGNQYFLSSNIVNGSTNIRQITYDPTTQLISVADPAWSVTGWNPDYRVYMPFVLKGNQYFLTTNADNGNAYIRQISLGASGKIVVSEPVWNDPGWNPEYTVYMPFVLNGNQYFLTANTSNGNANIRQISLSAGGRVIVSEPVWTVKGWNPDYTIYEPFVQSGNQYFLTANVISGNIIMRQISINASGKVVVSDPVYENAWRYERAEGAWRDAALQQLGYPPGWAGVLQYVEQIRKDRGTNWAYLSLITKYTPEHFGYALKPHLVINYENDGHGTDQIYITFAHETGHIFGASDEYKSSKCTAAPNGYYQVANNNCENINSNPFDCLMRNNKSSICEWSRGQFGWLFFSSVMPFTLANRQWILSQDYSFGHAMIQNIRTDGTTGNLIIEEPAWVEEWSPDYTVYMPFVLNSNQYFLTVNTVNGNANIRQISINAKGRMRVSEPVWTATRWNTDYRVYMPFVLNGNQYFLTANAGKGNADIRQISLDASGKVMVSEPVWIATRWNTDYTAYMPFVLNGNQYFLIANPGSGDANICQIGLDASGKVVVSAPVWIATRWNTDYTVYIPFVLNGGQYFLTTNPAKGDADIRQISLDASGKIMVGNAIWSAARWNVNYTLNAPFELNGTQYFLSVNNAKAQQNVRPIRATAHGVSVLDPVWTLP